MVKTSIEREVQLRTASFAAELAELIRSSVLETIHGALGSAPTGAAPASPARASGGAAAAPSKGGRPRGRGASAATTGAVTTFVAANPGSRLEQIAAGLGVPSAKLKKAVAGMLTSGELTKTGQKRGTMYHAGKALASAEGGGSAAAPKTAKRRGPKPGRKAKRVGKRVTTKKTA